MRGKSFGTVASPVVALGGVSGGGFKFVASTLVLVTGASTVVAPAGSTRCVAFVRGGGAGGKDGVSGGGGAAEEMVIFDVAPSETINCVVALGGARNTDGGQSSLVFKGQTLAVANGGLSAGPGGASTPGGKPGQAAPSAVAGGDSGGFVAPGRGASVGTPAPGLPGYGGGGGTVNATGGQGRDGGQGLVALIFMGQ